MKTTQKKRLAVASAVIAALSIYSQSAAALDLTDPAVMMSIPTTGSFWGMPTSINVMGGPNASATVALMVGVGGGDVIIPLASTATFIKAEGDDDRNIQGILVSGVSTLNLGSGSTVTSEGGGVFVYGTSTFNADKLTIVSGTKVDDTSISAADRSGLGVSDHSKVNLGQGSKITMAGDVNTTYRLSGYVSGVILEKSSELTADSLSVNVTSNTTDPRDLSGIRVISSNASLGSNSKIVTNGVHGVTIINKDGLATTPVNFQSTDGLYIETTGTNLRGIKAEDGSTVKLGGTSTIKTIGKGSTAIHLYTGSAKDSSLEADTLKISTTEGDGIYVSTSAFSVGQNYHATATIGAGSSIDAQNTVSGLSTLGHNAIINFNGAADSRNTINVQRAADSTNSNSLAGVWSSQYGVINLKNTGITVTAERLAETSGASNLIGLYAVQEGTVNANNVSIKVNDSANARYGVLAYWGSKIDLTGDTLIDVKDGIAIGTSLNSYFPAMDNNLVTGDGKMTLTGDIVVSGKNSVIDLKMQPNSLLTGGSAIDQLNKGKLNLSFTDSKWDMTKDSEATNLAVNNSTITFSEQKVGSTLTVANLSGNNGTFNMMVDVPALKSDLLIVTGTSAGAHHINALNQGGATTTGTEIIPMVQTKDGAATFDLANQVELGGYVYGLRRTPSDTTDWELYSSGPVVDPVNPVTPIVDPTNPTNPTPRSNISTTADASANFLNSAYLMNYAETQTLLQRMGELRQADNSQGDAWVRAYSGKFDSFDGGKLSGFDMSYTGTQLGADKRLSVEGGDLYLGGMVGFAEADPKFTSGDGSLKSYNLGIYATYVAENDFYVDGVLKYTHIKNSFNNVKDTQGNITSGDTSSDGYGISLEAGKRFYLQQPKSGFYIEPQAQISFSHLGGSSTTASNGLVTSIDSFDSTLGRLSALIGYEVKDGANPMNVYFKTGVVTEMSGNSNYALNGSKESNDFGGSWWENGIGLTAQINKQHNLYVEGTYSTGSRFDQMQINAGYRYSF